MEPEYGKGVFLSHVDVSDIGTHGVSRDDQPLDDPEGISLQDAPVHERPWITLVSVADHIFPVSGCIMTELPLQSGRESCSPPSPESRGLHDVDDLHFLHCECFGKPLEAILREVMLDIGGVDKSHVFQNDPFLWFDHRMIVNARNLPEAVSYHTKEIPLRIGALPDCLVKEFGNVIRNEISVRHRGVAMGLD